MKVLKKYTLLFTLFSLSIFQAQSSASSFSRFAAAASKKARPIAIKTGIGLAGGAGTYYGTKYALSYPKSSTISPEYLAKQELLDKDHEEEELLDKYRKEKEKRRKEKIKALQEELERDYPKISETNLPYLYRWFKEFKQSNPDAGFTTEIELREIYYPFPEFAQYSWTSIDPFGEYPESKIFTKVIACSRYNLEKLNDICKKKYADHEKLSSEDNKRLDEAKAVIFHEMYHLLDEAHAHGPKIPYYKRTIKDSYVEEFCADEHAMIHGTSQDLKAHVLYAIDATKYIEKKDPQIQDLQRQKAATWFWEHGKRKMLDDKIKARYQELDPIHPPLPDRIAYFEAAYKEKLALEERLARETPEENEENLRKLLEKGPRRSWPSADTPPTARLQ